MNKRKIVNDPLYGLISIPYDEVFDVLEHRYFQRLRRIRQLGLSQYVYPGATHTRFEHVLGAMHLMVQAVSVLRTKGFDITDEEAKGVVLAILLHDIGHGPFSHSLEGLIVPGYSHEVLSLKFMERLNLEFESALETCIAIFSNKYPKRFLHQLVSSQLDMDRLDYLGRDSFFTGVQEGVVGADRLIRMLSLHNDTLVIEAKGIYSVENFLIARRLMYWQVYLHKTALVAEKMLQAVMNRAKELALTGVEVFASPALAFFLYNGLANSGVVKSYESDDLLEWFSRLDDTDVLVALKVWATHSDFVLSSLSKALINRKLFRIEIREEAFSETEYEELRLAVVAQYHISEKESSYFVFGGSVSNHAYSIKSDKIGIVFKDGSVRDISNASDMLNTATLSKNVTKYFRCYPKDLRL